MLKPATNNLNPSACAPFSVYDDYSELPTAIKQAEQGATARAMADFTRRTTRLAFVIALGLLLLSLALSAAMGFRAVTRSQANYSAFRSDLSRFASADSSILELRSIDAGTYTVYLDSSYWENASSTERAAYCENLNSAVDSLCHEYNLLGRREQAQLYYYDRDGAMLAAPGDDLQSVLMR